jgi:hypothetical protein
MIFGRIFIVFSLSLSLLCAWHLSSSVASGRFLNATQRGGSKGITLIFTLNERLPEVGCSTVGYSADSRSTSLPNAGGKELNRVGK